MGYCTIRRNRVGVVHAGGGSLTTGQTPFDLGSFRASNLHNFPSEPPFLTRFLFPHPFNHDTWLNLFNQYPILSSIKSLRELNLF